jgi:nitrate/nitrite-specific signal transduction histidine kinase
VLLTLSLLRDENGEPSAVSSMAKDISQQKAADAELRRYQAELEERVAARTAELAEGQQRLTLALDAGGMGTWENDLVANIN